MPKQNLQTNKVSVHISGVRQICTCPFCEKIVQDWGDFRNPTPTIMGEKMCDDCKAGIRKLLKIKKD